MYSQKSETSQNSKMPKRACMPKPQRIYYAHPVTHYGEPIEDMDVAMLERLGFEVVNPNTPEHHNNYVLRGMDYFLDLVAQCEWIAVRPFLDGMIGAGVAAEFLRANRYGKPSIIIRPIIGELTIEETRQRIAKGVV